MLVTLSSSLLTIGVLRLFNCGQLEDVATQGAYEDSGAV